MELKLNHKWIYIHYFTILEYGKVANLFTLENQQDFVAECRKNYTDDCHATVITNIYLGYCTKEKKKVDKDDYYRIFENVGKEDIKCEDLICLIFRNLNLDVDKIPTAYKAFENMYYLWNKENNVEILV